MMVTIGSAAPRTQSLSRIMLAVSNGLANEASFDATVGAGTLVDAGASVGGTAVADDPLDDTADSDAPQAAKNRTLINNQKNLFIISP